MARIADRVREGGHSGPEETVRRRFGKSLFNFTYYYRALADTGHLFDNSSEKPRAIAEYGGQFRVFDSRI